MSASIQTCGADMVFATVKSCRPPCLPHPSVFLAGRFLGKERKSKLVCTDSRNTLTLIRAQKKETNSEQDPNKILCPLSTSLITMCLAFSLSFSDIVGLGYTNAKEGVNKPELLPKDFTPLIDVAGFLSPSQEKRIIKEIMGLENDTGFKLRVLAQNYPETPGLAIRDFWQVDDNTVVFVADPTFGNILNFNVGASIDLNVPRSFWSRLAAKYGNIFYWRERGEDASIEAAVSAISACLREPLGPNACSEIK